MKNGAKHKKTHGSSEPKLLQVCALLNKAHAHYVVIGGVALNLHGLIRATKDIDILIPKDTKNTQAVLDALKGLTFGMASELDADEVAHKPITIIGDIPRVDLLTVAGKVKYEDAAKKAKKAKISGVWVMYADLDTLIKTKDTDRLQDKADVERLQMIMRKK